MREKRTQQMNASCQVILRRWRKLKKGKEIESMEGAGRRLLSEVAGKGLFSPALSAMQRIVHLVLKQRGWSKTD